jgi:hypothetical protein
MRQLEAARGAAIELLLAFRRVEQTGETVDELVVGQHQEQDHTQRAEEFESPLERARAEEHGDEAARDEPEEATAAPREDDEIQHQGHTHEGHPTVVTA